MVSFVFVLFIYLIFFLKRKCLFKSFVNVSFVVCMLSLEENMWKLYVSAIGQLEEVLLKCWRGRKRKRKTWKERRVWNICFG